MKMTNQDIKECIDLRACAYTNWYKKFRKITLNSVCVPIPDEIVKYLLDEIIMLPKECYGNDDEDHTFDGVECDNDDEEDDVVQPEFPEFSQTLSNTISRLGGAVFVKTNWNSPKDAFWITAGQTMCCKDITDIYQLLKASGICKEDLACHNLPVFDLDPLEEANSSSTDSDSSVTDSTGNNQFLVFKKWQEIHPGTEFRCFVRNKKLIGISPRDWPQYHEFICTQRVNIVRDIVSIFKEHIKPKFPLYDYVFDVVRDAKDRVFLLDFAPFNEKYSEALAFEWNELLDDSLIRTDADDVDEEDPEFRYLSSNCGIQPNKRNNYGIPKDVIDMFRPSSSSSDDPSTSQSLNTLDDVINNRLENIFLNQRNDEQNTE